MKCPKCGADMREDFVFCGICGEKLNYDQKEQSDNIEFTYSPKKILVSKNIIGFFTVLTLVIFAVLLTYFATHKNSDKPMDFDDELQESEEDVNGLSSLSSEEAELVNMILEPVLESCSIKHPQLKMPVIYKDGVRYKDFLNSKYFEDIKWKITEDVEGFAVEFSGNPKNGDDIYYTIFKFCVYPEYQNWCYMDAVIYEESHGVKSYTSYTYSAIGEDCLAGYGEDRPIVARCYFDFFVYMFAQDLVLPISDPAYVDGTLPEGMK